MQELLKRNDVHWAVKLAILGGEDPMVFGGTIPAIMMTKLESLGIQHAEIGGSMNVGESNKATQGSSTHVESKTNVGAGFAFWHAQEQLTVRHAAHDDQTRATDYRAKVNWKVEMGPMGEPEGVGLIKEASQQAFTMVQTINQALADAQAEVMKGKAKPATEEDADSDLASTDIKDDDGGGGGAEDEGTQTDEGDAE